MRGSYIERKSYDARDLRRLENHCKRNCMRFNKDKCSLPWKKVITSMHPCWLGLDWQECNLSEKDLWIQEERQLNISKQPSPTAGKHTAGCNSKTIANRAKDVINPQYLAFVKPHQECCVQFWSSKFKRDVKIGKCQPR